MRLHDVTYARFKEYTGCSDVSWRGKISLIRAASYILTWKDGWILRTILFISSLLLPNATALGEVHGKNYCLPSSRFSGNSPLTFQETEV